MLESAQNIKIVIGNGFDLFCRLQTRYSNYFEYRNDDYKFIRDKYEEFKNDKAVVFEETPPNIWDCFFALIIEYKNINWCDIEEEMLKSLEKNIDLMTDNNYFRWHHIFLRMQINRDYAKYSQNVNNFHNIENFIMNIIGYKSSRSEKQFYRFLLDELISFEKNFGSYVMKELNDNIILYNSFSNYFFSLFGVSKNPFYLKVNSIDTFNYTVPWENKLGLKYNYLFHYINGNYHNPIFGIDSKDFDATSCKYIFTKISRRLLSEKKPLENSVNLLVDNLVIFGHSLNKQDYNYFFPIFDHLKLCDITSKTTIVFAYDVYDRLDEDAIRSTYINNIAKIMNDYEKYSTGNSEHRLFESLVIQGRIILYKIPYLVLKKENINSFGFVDPYTNNFVVLKDSYFVINNSDELYKELVSEGIVKNNQFIKDYIFHDIKAASRFLSGNNDVRFVDLWEKDLE